MNWSFSLGRVLGTELRLHLTFVLLLAWITLGAWTAEGAQAALSSLAFMIALFGCVVLHELGHAAMAARFGIKTPDITLLPIGGLARLERIPEDPKQEILIAVAGPLVNVVIWLLLVLVAGAELRFDLKTLDEVSQGFGAALASVNLMLVAFNAIPAFPMDGGRVFRAGLAFFMGREKATDIAAKTGQIIAVLFAFWGLSGGSPMLILIAVFIYFAAGAESADVSLRGLAHRARARDVVITSFVSLHPDDTLEQAAQAILHTSQSEFPVLDLRGHLVGFLTRASVLAHPEPEHWGKPVSAFMAQNPPCVARNTGMDFVLDAFAASNIPAVGVTGPSGAFVGYINRENIGEWFILARR